ncbi:MAG: YdcF family protein [Lachnospiraceae bacterium]|nr:YdcF family protein [Lachnospiraceae bacterium]
MKNKRNTKDNLIPFQNKKRRRAIQADRRGKAFRTRRLAAIVVGILAAASVAYCVCIRLFMGYGTYFFLIWGLIGLVLGGFAFLLWRRDVTERIPRALRRVFWCCLAVGFLLFAVIEGRIIGQFGAQAQEGADYCIVLGAWWRGDRPSYILKQRLDTAVAYLQRNPDTQVIVSGGQGANESMPEADGMALYLEAEGIAPERIIRENKSGNTDENLAFSAAYLDRAKDRTVIVTNNFHVYRAVKIAEKQGYVQIEGLAAPSYVAMVPNNLLREFFGVLKDTLAGNM